MEDDDQCMFSKGTYWLTLQMLWRYWELDEAPVRIYDNNYIFLIYAVEQLLIFKHQGLRN